MPSIVLYTSSHGFGHAVRCAAVCRALLDASPGLRVVARTGAPAWIFPAGVEVQAAQLDAGVVQPSSLDIDGPATLARYAAHVATEDAAIEHEVAIVGALDARAIVADIPSAAFAIAAKAGVPGIGLANFSWDWIYEPFMVAAPGAGDLLARLRRQYGQASRLLRLPFHEGLTAFPVVEDVPLIARRSVADRDETRRRLGLPVGASLILYSFGGHAGSGPDAASLRNLGEHVLVTTGGTATGENRPRAERRGPNLFVVPPLADEYVDLLAACDAIVTKPGYGIVADAIANRVPTLYVSRGGFREEPILARALEREARAVPLSRAALDALDLGPALDQLAALDRPWSDRPLDGAEVVARRILDLAGL